MLIRAWWSDLITSFTPVLSPRSGGEFMQNSPKYAALWAVTKVSGTSDKRGKEIENEPKSGHNNSVSTVYTGDRESLRRKPSSEVNCELVGEPLNGLGVVTDCYSYEDEDGKTAFQVLRLEPKTFRQRSLNADGEWIWKNGRRDLIYRLPLVKRAISEGNTIYVVEGERDVLTLLDQGYVATTAPGGASGPGQKPKWLIQHTMHLAGAPKVVVIADNDLVGRAHAIQVYKSLQGHVDEVELKTVSRGTDVTECFDLGGSLNDLIDFDPEREEQVGEKVNSFLYAHPEFVPQRDLVWQTLSYVRDPGLWDAELDNLVDGTFKEI